MSWKKLDQSIIATLIAEQGDRFGTRAISEDPRLKAAHPSLSRARNWHAWVGRCISAENGNGTLPSLRKSGRAGKQQLWERVGDAPLKRSAPLPALPPPMASAAPRTTPEATDALGPQYAGDAAFTAAQRLHQSRYRAEVLGLPCGTGPRPGSTTHYGNMLRAEDAERGANFLTPAIFAQVQRRLTQGTDRVEPFRLLHNMLSSQPMCFNLFGPLADDTALASRLVSAMLGKPVQVVEVRIEYSPAPAADYLADRTSFDAYIEYLCADGRGFVGIETKLTEPFSPTRYDRPEYRRWMRAGGPWREPASERVADIAHNQLWRDHLLAVALRDHTPGRFVEGGLWLVRHPGDDSCARVTATYASLLTDGDSTFADWPLDRLLDTWSQVAPEQQSWLDDFRERYAVGR